MTNRGRQWHEGLSGLLPAETALRRLVVMTPFIDASGFRWLPRMLETTHANCQRIIVLRNADQYTVELGVQHGDWLRAMQVSVRDYHLSHYPAEGRALPIETFHAKVVVADDMPAYVGSANLLSSSEGLSLGLRWVFWSKEARRPRWLGLSMPSFSSHGLCEPKILAPDVITPRGMPSA
jgi:hypothetical protein